MLYEGQSLTVQVTKDPIGTKGARLTTHISIPSCFLVFMPNNEHIGISQKIEDETVREYLKKQLEECVGELEENSPDGFIIRTAAETATREELQTDIQYLKGSGSC